MNKPQRKSPPPHTLIVDTSILWHKDKSNVVAPDFDSFWQRHAADSLTLVLPAVVRSELLFQQTTSALRALEKAESHIREVSAVTGKSYSHRVTEARVRREVEDRFDRWAAAKGAVIELTPVASIDWNRVIHASLWRQPPFTFDSKNPEIEKGFRDSLILETLCHYVEAHASENITFVCVDRLLRETSEKRLVGYAKCTFFESMDEMASYLRLTKEKLTDKFVKSILTRARRKFYTKRDKSSLYFAERIYKRITAEYSAQLEVREEYSDSILNALTATARSVQWVRSGHEKLRVGSTKFERLEEPRTFYWNTTFSIIRPYQRQSTAIAIAALGTPEEKVLVADFLIRWRSSVTKAGAFRSCTVDSIDLVNRSFDILSRSDKERFGLVPSGRSAPSGIR
jgi:hypothetical protein